MEKIRKYIDEGKVIRDDVFEKLVERVSVIIIISNFNIDKLILLHILEVQIVVIIINFIMQTNTILILAALAFISRFGIRKNFALIIMQTTINTERTPIIVYFPYGC